MHALRLIATGVGLVLSLVLLGDGLPAHAQSPKPPVRIVVPFQVGGAADLAARVLAEGLSSRMAEPFFVENRPGATGILGTEVAAAATPDGRTLFMGHSDTIVLNPLLRKKLPYDASKEFGAIAFVSKVPGVLIASPASGIDSGEALIKAAKARPGRVSMATWGIGSSPHLGMELMDQVAGIEMLHVPFQSTGAAVGALLAAQVDLAWVTPEFAVASAAQGKVLIVGGSSIHPISRVPNIRPLAEQGFPGVDISTWYGLMAPPGTPLALRRQLHDAVNALLHEPTINRRLREGGHEVQTMTLEEFESFVAADRARWRALISARKLEVEPH